MVILIILGVVDCQVLKHSYCSTAQSHRSWGECVLKSCDACAAESGINHIFGGLKIAVFINAEHKMQGGYTPSLPSWHPPPPLGDTEHMFGAMYTASPPSWPPITTSSLFAVYILCLPYPAHSLAPLMMPNMCSALHRLCSCLFGYLTPPRGHVE